MGKVNVYVMKMSEMSKEGTCCKGYVQETEDSPEAMEKIIGERVTVYPLTPEIDVITGWENIVDCCLGFEELSGEEVLMIAPEIDLAMREDGILKRKPVNRVLTVGDHVPDAVLVGNVLCARHPEGSQGGIGSYTSIQPEDIEVIHKLLFPVRRIYKKFDSIFGEFENIFELFIYNEVTDEELPEYTGDRG